jgi:hypothetical protein
VLRGPLPSITTPAQIIAGREDDLVPWSNNEYLADLLPNGEIHPLSAGHFACEQAPDEYGRLIVDWVTGGFQRHDDARRPEISDAPNNRSRRMRLADAGSLSGEADRASPHGCAAMSGQLAALGTRRRPSKSR